jgi:ATP-dependent RNA helicase RhlB
MMDDSEAPEAPDVTPRADKPDFLTEKRFDGFELPLEVMAGLKDAGFEHCTPIQAQALPVLLQGRDVAGQAQTGTGKTAAFLVTVISRLLAVPNRKTGLPQALIMAPTRELSRQIHEEAQVLSRHTDITLLEVVGGIDYREQAESLKKGVDIVIGTPGRIIDYFKQGVFKTTDIKFLVIDEADRLLDLGFEKDMRYILRKLPFFEKRQSMLFSATLSYRVLELTYEFMNLPEFISVTPDVVTVEGVEQSLFHVGKDRKLQLLLGLLQREEWSRILMFVNMKVAVDRLTFKLKANGLPAEGITGDLPQRQRFQLMERFKNGQIKILVATDVASRGIHVEDISHVINYDLPQEAENYIHRIGRTARAGKTGRAISLACEDYVTHLESIETMLGHKLPVVWPEDDWFVEDRAPRADPARRERRGRSDRPERGGGRRDRPERGAGRRDRPEPAGGRRDRDRGREQPSRAETPKELKTKRIPGAFFGFGPALAEEPEVLDTPIETPVQAPVEAVVVAPVERPEASEGVAPAPPERPKKRRRRRKKKAAPAGGISAVNGGAPPEPVEPSPSEAMPNEPA